MTQLEYKLDPLALERLNVCLKCKNLDNSNGENRCSLRNNSEIKYFINEEFMRCPIEKW